MTAVAASQTAMTAVAASSTAMAAVTASPTAMAAIATSSMATAKYAASAAGLNPADYADMTELAASSTAMTAVAASSTARTAVVASTAAVSALSSSPIATTDTYNFATSETTYRSGNVWLIYAQTPTASGTPWVFTNLYESPSTWSCANTTSDQTIARFASKISGSKSSGSATEIKVRYIPC